VKSLLRADAARRVGLVVLDVDGVLTDGGIWVGAGGDGRMVELKRFDITDQLGVKMMVWTGLPVALVSGRPSPATRLKAEELGVPIHEGPGGFKLPIVERLHAEHGIGWSETACVCDDLADLPLMRRAGLAVAVANAVGEIRAAAHWTTTRRGGNGAVREFAEALLRARGVWTALVERYVQERESVKA
jgi:3-deoxy-D-manno-octulosonate 8-phosphate phosphatase (KDO 8-P phosphatase)